MKTKPNTKLFRIHLSVQEAGKYKKNRWCRVFAESAQKAIALVLERHPGGEIWSVNHEGTDTDEGYERFVVDPDCYETL